MSNNETEKMSRYIEEQLENGYTPEQVAAMLVHAWGIEANQARGITARVRSDWMAREQTRRKKVRVGLAMGGALIAVGLVPTVVSAGLVLPSLFVMVPGIVLVVVAFKNMR